MSEEKVKITKSSGNVFTDLGLSDADDLKFKTGLVVQIHKLINSRKLTQLETSKLVNVPQPKLSALMKGDFTGFSTDRLFRILQDLGQDIEIKITPAVKPTTHGKVTVLTPRPATKKVAAGHPAVRKATASKPKPATKTVAKAKSTAKTRAKSQPRMQG